MIAFYLQQRLVVPKDFISRSFTLASSSIISAGDFDILNG
jgi:hypothetical protein